MIGKRRPLRQAAAVALALVLLAPLCGCSMRGKRIVVVSPEMAKKYRVWLALERDEPQEEGCVFQYRLVCPKEYDADLTWTEEQMGGASKPTQLIWNGTEVGAGVAGMEAVLQRMRELPVGSSLLLYPTTHTLMDLHRPRASWPLWVYGPDAQGEPIDYYALFKQVAAERQISVICTEYGPVL